MHAVDAPKNGRLTASGWSDEGHHRIGPDSEVNALNGKEVAVVDI
jgi:hypothetical protein